MLDIFNNLKPFFEDCYREISVREYSRLLEMSAPTASIRLKMYASEGILKNREDKRYLLFRANRESSILRDLSRIYWRIKINSLIETFKENLHNPQVILFGSLSKLEAKPDSDIDLAVISKTPKKIDIGNFERQFRRKIQVFYFKSFKEIKEALKLNIINGYILEGVLE